MNDPSVAHALYAEALDELDGTDPAAPAPDDVALDGFARFQGYLQLLAAEQRSHVVSDVIGRLGREPFASANDFAPVLGASITGVIDSRRHHRVLHVDQICSDRWDNRRSQPIEGAAAAVLAEPRVKPCGVCSDDLAPIADWIRNREKWVRVRNSTLTVVEDLSSGGPARVDSLWAMLTSVGWWLGLRSHMAVRLVSDLSALSAERSDANGARRAAEFDAAVYLALHEAARRAPTAQAAQDLAALRDALGDDHPVDELVDEAVNRRSSSPVFRARVERRLAEAWEPVFQDAIRLHGTLHDRPGRPPSHINGPVERIALARRVLMTHGVKLAETRWRPDLGFASPPSEAVAKMMAAVKENLRTSD